MIKKEEFYEPVCMYKYIEYNIGKKSIKCNYKIINLVFQTIKYQIDLISWMLN